MPNPRKPRTFMQKGEIKSAKTFVKALPRKCIPSKYTRYTHSTYHTNVHCSRCNTAQLVADQDGGIIVPTYNWIGFLIPHFKKLIGMKKGHHFRVHCPTWGSVVHEEEGRRPNRDGALLEGTVRPWGFS